MLGQQNYWTLIGVDAGGQRSGLISGDGALELGRGGPSVEPAVRLADGRLTTWADVALQQSLADGSAANPQLLSRYRLRNLGATQQTFILALALRPWQVNPPQQFLSTPGGASAVTDLRRDAARLHINRAGLSLQTSQLPQRVTALPLDGGLSLTALLQAPAGHTLLRPQLGARRRDDGGRPLAHGRGGGGARVRRLVCRLCLRVRQGALLRLGQPERAHAMLDFFFQDQRPAGWLQWAEVVLPDAREPRFLGDMPHAWISADFIRSVLGIFAFERGPELLIGAGIKPSWLAAAPVGVRGLGTSFGPLDYRLTPNATGWHLDLGRAGAPVVLRWPGSEALPVVQFHSQTLSWVGRELRLPPAPVALQLINKQVERPHVLSQP